MKKINMKSFISSLLIALGFVCSYTSYAQGLKDIAQDKGVFIGAIMTNELVNNINHDRGRPNEIIREEFNALVLENAMKMDNLLSTRPANPFDFGIEAFDTEGIDRFMRYAKDDVPSAKLKTRGHTMIWYNAVPRWLSNEAPNWSRQQVYDFTYQYIRALASHCGNRIDEWDVVNEALHDGRGTGPFRSGAWYNSVGNNRAALDDYFKFCFETAREFAPNSKLFYNDYSIEEFNTNSGSKNARMRAFIQRLQENGAPIDGVGFQSHFVLDQVASNGSANANFMNSVERSMEFLDDLNLEVAITELDIRRCGGQGTDADHKAIFKAFTRMTLSEPNCNTLLIWGISDKDSWTIPVFNCDYSLIYNNNYGRKSAYFGMREALNDLLNIGEFANEITRVIAPDAVAQGERVTVSIEYSSAGENDLVVLMQLDDVPYTVYDVKRIPIFKEQVIQDIEFRISFDVPVAEAAYQFQAFLAPVGGEWEDRLSDLNKNDIDVVEGVREAKEPFLAVLEIPGTVEAEHFDKGGQGVSYNDSDPTNNGADGSGFRIDDGVDVAGSDGNYAVGWTADGEWLEYTVNVQESGLYRVDFFVSALPSTGLLGLTLGGQSVLTAVAVESTGDWNTVASFSEDVTLEAGQNLLRLEIERSGFNIDKMVFERLVPTSSSDLLAPTYMSVYPNPSASGVFNLNSASVWSVLNVQGENITSGSGDEVDLSAQPKGMYLLNVGSNVFKIVVD